MAYNQQQQPGYGGQPDYGQQQPGYGQPQPGYGQQQPGSVEPYGGAPLPPVPVADFSSGVCDCTKDWETCMDGCFCFYCSLGFQSKTLETQKGGNMDVLICAGLCICDAILFMGLCGSFYNACSLRPRVNRHYQILEGAGKACLLGFCCATCSVCQTHREMNYRKDHPGGVCSKVPAPLGPAMGPGPATAQPVQQGVPAQPQPQGRSTKEV